MLLPHLTGAKQSVCHVNLLKAYHERDTKLFPEIPSSAVPVTNSILCEPEETLPELAGGDVVVSVGPDPDHLDRGQLEQLNRLLSEYADILSDIPGKTCVSQHHIELLPNTKPVRCSPYRLSPQKTEYLRKELAELLDLGIVEPSESLWASPIVMVPKSDGTLRLCTDFRKVNAVTQADPFPLPRVEDLLDRIGHYRYLTKLDMTRGYWQVPQDDPSVPISAFVTPFGHFQWRYMAFGLRNAGATFSRLVSKLLHGLESFCAAYLDDVVIYSDTWQEHLQNIKTVFDRIRQAKLTLNRRKCCFAAAEVDYLGHHVGLGKVQPKAQKVQALLEYPTPTSRKQL